ncbi:hypothetical protein GC176_09390 [bacterium]|nr:hypothetical protein [bacterium]
MASRTSDIFNEVSVMSAGRDTRAFTKQRRGAIALLAAVFLVVIFAFTAFTVDLGYIAIVDQELQAAVDSSALAAAYELKSAQGTDVVRDTAQELAGLNKVNGRTLALNRDSDIELGFWDETTGTFTAFPVVTDISLTNAVRVTGRLSRDRNSQVNLFFAPILGQNNAEIQSSAIAVIGRDKERDVMLVIDCSGSMSDYHRMVYTLAAAQVLIDELGDKDRLGLTVYSYPALVDNTLSNNNRRTTRGSNRGRGNNGGSGGGANGQTRLTGHLEKALSFSFQPVISRLPHLLPALYASQTCIGGGMRVAIEEFIAFPRDDSKGNKVQQVMVLMTDGIANVTEPPGTDPVDSIYYYADLAKQHDIIIHGITLGRDADESPIRYCADTTGGQYYHVEDSNFEGLFDIYRGIGRGDDQPRLVR